MSTFTRKAPYVLDGIKRLDHLPRTLRGRLRQPPLKHFLELPTLVDVVALLVRTHKGVVDEKLGVLATQTGDLRRGRERKRGGGEEEEEKRGREEERKVGREEERRRGREEEERKRDTPPIY